jgi:hypothetical protein
MGSCYVCTTFPSLIPTTQNYEGMPANTTAAQRSSAMSRSMSIATFMPTHHHSTNNSSSSSYGSPSTLAAAGNALVAAARAGSAAATSTGDVPPEGELTLASAVTTLNGLGSAQHSLYMDLVVNGPGRVTFGQPAGAPPRPPSPLQAAPTMTAYFQQIEEGDEENEDGIFF